VTLPVRHQQTIRVLTVRIDRLPLPHAFSQEVRPLRSLLEAKYVTGKRSSKAP
jgi:hypothetical protein